jgi:two-component sensor histidine kinase
MRPPAPARHVTDPPATARHGGQRERRWVALLIAAAATGVVALGTGLGMRDIAAVEERARTTVETASALLREHAAAVFGASDTLLRQAVSLAGANGAPPPPTRETHEFLRTLADTVPSALAIWFGDADGLATVTSREFPAPPLNAAGRDYFRVHQEGADVGVFVTALPDNRYRGQPVIVLSRAVRDAEGRMTGFATTNIDRDQLRSAYRRQGGEFSLGVTLARTDGTVLLREPVVETIALPARVPSTDADVTWPDGFGRWTSGFDGVRWIGRVAPVEGMPLVMSVAVPVAEVAAARRAVAMRFAGATGLGLALVGGFGWLAWRGAGRLERQVADRTADLSAALAARDLLIREINHRVMNTLALASSMVRLQRRRAGEDAVAAALLVTERRLSALANVHLQLHRSDAVEWVAMDAYLHDLARHFGEAAGEVTVVAAADPMRMRTEAAVKVGIVTAELVLNALKHAFDPDAAGGIRVDLRRSGTGWRLSVADDGRGLPPEGATSGGLGMTVVAALARDLDAQVRVERPSRGASIVLDVPHAAVLAPD